DQQAGLPISYGVAEAWGIGGQRRGAARCSLHHRDPPPLLRGRKHIGRGPPQESDLGLLIDEPEEADRVAQATVARQFLQAGAVIAGPGDIDRQLGPLTPGNGKGLYEMFDPFVTLESPDVDEPRRLETRQVRVRRERDTIDAGIHHRNALARNAPRHEI